MPNQTQTVLAPHEVLEVHEFMRTEVIGIKKLQMSLPTVRDGDLKSFMESSLKMKKQMTHNLEQLFFKATNNRLQ